MLMRKNKCLAILVALCMLVPSSYAFADEAQSADDTCMANAGGSASSIEPMANTTDRNFKFTFSYSGATSNGGENRRKDNSTQVYVRVDSITCDRCRAYVDRYANSKWINSTSSGKATIKKKGQFGIKTESSAIGCLVRLTGWADSTKGVVSGVWSPDSSKTYTQINGD